MAGKKGSRPNIILFMSDVGWGDPGYHGGVQKLLHSLAGDK